MAKLDASDDEYSEDIEEALDVRMRQTRRRLRNQKKREMKRLVEQGQQTQVRHTEYRDRGTPGTFRVFSTEKSTKINQPSDQDLKQDENDIQQETNEQFKSENQDEEDLVLNPQSDVLDSQQQANHPIKSILKPSTPSRRGHRSDSTGPTVFVSNTLEQHKTGLTPSRQHDSTGHLVFPFQTPPTNLHTDRSLHLSDIKTQWTGQYHPYQTPSSSFMAHPQSTLKRPTTQMGRKPQLVKDLSALEIDQTPSDGTLQNTQEFIGFKCYSPTQTVTRKKSETPAATTTEDDIKTIQKEAMWNSSTIVEKKSTLPRPKGKTETAQDSQTAKLKWMEKTRREVEMSRQPIKKRVKTMFDPLATAVSDEEDEILEETQGFASPLSATHTRQLNHPPAVKKSVFSSKELKLLRWMTDNGVDVFLHYPKRGDAAIQQFIEEDDDSFFATLPHHCVCTILADGVSLPSLLHSVTHHQVNGAISNPKYAAAKRNNIERCLTSLRARNTMPKRYLFKLDELCNGPDGESAESISIAWGLLEDIANEFKFSTPNQKATLRRKSFIKPKPVGGAQPQPTRQQSEKSLTTKPNSDLTSTFVKMPAEKDQIRPTTAKKVRFVEDKQTTQQTRPKTALKPSFSPSLSNVLRQHVIEDAPKISIEEENSCVSWLRNEVLLNCPDISHCFALTTLQNPLANGVLLSDLVTMCRRAASIRDDWTWKNDSGFNIKTGRFVDPFSEEAQRLASEKKTKAKDSELASQKNAKQRRQSPTSKGKAVPQSSSSSETKSMTSDRIGKLIGTSGKVASPHDTIPHFKCFRAPKSLEQVRENYRIVFTWLMWTERVDKQFLWDTEPYLQGNRGMIFGILLNIRRSFGDAINDLYRVYGSAQPFHYSGAIEQKTVDASTLANSIRANGLATTLAQGESVFREKPNQKSVDLPYSLEQRYNLEQSLIQWVNELTLIPGPFINSFSVIVQAVRTGTLLGELYYLITGKRLNHFDSNPQTDLSKRKNVERSLEALKQVEGLWHVNNYPVNLVCGGDWEAILGLMEDLHCRYDLQPPPARHRIDQPFVKAKRSVTPTTVSRTGVSMTTQKDRASSAPRSPKKLNDGASLMEEPHKEEKVTYTPYFGQHYKEQSINQSQVQQQRDTTMSNFLNAFQTSAMSPDPSQSIASGFTSLNSTMMTGLGTTMGDRASFVGSVAFSFNPPFPPIYSSENDLNSTLKSNVIAPRPTAPPNKKNPSMSYHDNATGRTKTGFLGPDVFTSTDIHADETDDGLSTTAGTEFDRQHVTSILRDTNAALSTPSPKSPGVAMGISKEGQSPGARSSVVSFDRFRKQSHLSSAMSQSNRLGSDKRSVFGRSTSMTKAAAQLAQSALRSKRERRFQNIVFSSEDFSTTLNHGDHLIPPPPQAVLQRKTVENQNENGTINLTKLALESSSTQDEVNKMADQVNPSTGYLLSKWMESLGLKVASPFTLESPVVHEFSDGVLLCRLVEKLNHVPLHGWTKQPKNQASFLHNINLVLTNLTHNKKIPLSFLNCARDIMAGHQEVVVDLLEAIRKGYRVTEIPSLHRARKP
ncbi:hypothetical protein BLNAU_6268 [Blattamonas nauphoetae]|uniref:Calponin-homology (CH) domain-containing protein n=1 Tax=Blattamonas nauphoetae TaxID=2049346 RepID=A0ABQ9Y4U4_9EUKA|nr:hypothetical protein BLNAU_6268 [Blattamonas nauphoetae]